MSGEKERKGARDAQQDEPCVENDEPGSGKRRLDGASSKEKKDAPLVVVPLAGGVDEVGEALGAGGSNGGTGTHG